LILFGFDMEFSSEVYVPREDTYLMVEILRDEVNQDDKVLDMGTGSGILAMISAEVCETVVAVDLNDKAVELGRKNASSNGLENIEFVKSDLFENVDGVFDLVVFNAPYLPYEGSVDRDLKGSEQWCGGGGGREILSRFMDGVEDHLSEDGRVLFLISSLTNLDEVESMLTDGGFEYEVVGKRKIPWEELYVVRVQPGD